MSSANWNVSNNVCFFADAQKFTGKILPTADGKLEVQACEVLCDIPEDWIKVGFYLAKYLLTTIFIEFGKGEWYDCLWVCHLKYKLKTSTGCPNACNNEHISTPFGMV